MNGVFNSREEKTVKKKKTLIIDSGGLAWGNNNKGIAAVMNSDI